MAVRILFPLRLVLFTCLATGICCLFFPLLFVAKRWRLGRGFDLKYFLTCKLAVSVDDPRGLAGDLTEKAKHPVVFTFAFVLLLSSSTHFILSSSASLPFEYCSANLYLIFNTKLLSCLQYGRPI